MKGRRWVCFFFQAEDGIRDRNVTGVQTCALPIWARERHRAAADAAGRRDAGFLMAGGWLLGTGYETKFRTMDCRDCARRAGGRADARAEGRRVGKECMWWWGAYDDDGSVRIGLLE